MSESARPAGRLIQCQLSEFYWALSRCRSAVLRTLYNSFSSVKHPETRVAMRRDTPAAGTPSAVSDAAHWFSAYDPRIPIVKQTISTVHSGGSAAAILSRSGRYRSVL